MTRRGIASEGRYRRSAPKPDVAGDRRLGVDCQASFRYPWRVRPKGFIGVVHLRAMPGDPRYEEGGFDAVVAAALDDARALVEGGVGHLIIENFGSVPFDKGGPGARLAPHAIAVMARVADGCRRLNSAQVSVGINCLRNDAISAVGIAAAVGADFVRVNVHTGAMLTDQGLIEGEAAATLRYRRALDADPIAILADVQVKHAAPIAPVTLADAARDCVHRGLADGVIVTGQATGAPTDEQDIDIVRAAVPETPVYIGSGLTPDNAASLLARADGAIVGTWVKRDGDVRAPVDVARVRTLATYFVA